MINLIQKSKHTINLKSCRKTKTINSLEDGSDLKDFYILMFYRCLVKTIENKDFLN